MRIPTLAAALLVLLCGVARAQTEANPVLTHYRAYTAAMQQQDFVAAEAAASAAVDASIARDGDGGRTDILLVNLADVRIQLDRPVDALAPAQRALRIAESGAADSGVEPLLPRLYVGAAQLLQSDSGARTRLLRDVQDAVGREGYGPAGAMVGRRLAEFEMSQGRMPEAREAWTAALAHLPEGDENAIAARIEALIARGAVLASMDEIDFRGNPEIGTNIERGPSGLAERDYAEALRLVFPYASQVGDGSFASAQRLYAQALAWRLTLASHLSTYGWREPEEGSEFRSLTLALGGNSDLPVCRMAIDASPPPRYPMSAAMNYRVGVVVVRAVSNADGEITEIQPVAAVGGAPFLNAVADVAQRWRLRRLDDYSDPCNKAAVRLTAIQFRVG